jgi:hypothetical protein
VDGLKKSLADAHRQLAVQSRHLHQQVQRGGYASGGAGTRARLPLGRPLPGMGLACGAGFQGPSPISRVAAGCVNGSGRRECEAWPCRQGPAARGHPAGASAPRARFPHAPHNHPAPTHPLARLQWRKSMMLEAQTKLLADVQLVVDAPGRIQAALDVQVGG